MNTRRRRSASALCLALAFLSFGSASESGAGASPAGEAPRDGFSESSSVVAVEVPVNVVHDGEPVRGLSAADFEIDDGGRAQKITGFEVVDLAPAAAGETTASPALAIAARRHFLLLFDLTHVEPSAIVRARQAAHRLIETRVQASDLVAVASFSRSAGAKLVVGFTPDRRQAAYAIDAVGLPEVTDRHPDPLALLVSSQAETGGATAKNDRDRAFITVLEDAARVESRAARQIQRDDVAAMTRSLADLAHLLGGVAGRKYVVFLSQGFDSSLVQGFDSSAVKGGADEEAAHLVHAQAASGEHYKISSEDRYGDTRTANDLHRMLDEFRRADCMIESVDIGGLTAAAEQGVQHAGGTDSLFMMAHETGGELFHNTNDLAAAMAGLLARTSVTYVLSFQPAGLPADGSYHPLRIRVKNARGLQVLYRPGYYAPRPFAQLTAVERQLAAAGMVLGAAAGGQFATAILAAPFPVPGQQAYVPVVVEIAGSGLLAGARDVAQAEIYAYALDEQGTIHDHFGQVLGLDLRKVRGALESGGIKLYGHLDLDPGRYVIRALVRNSITGAASVAAAALTVPAFDGGEPALLPPLFPGAAGSFLVLRESGGREKLRDVPLPFRSAQGPFLPAARPVLAAGAEAPLFLLASGLSAGERTVEGRVFTVDGRAVPGGAVALAGGGGIVQGLEELPAVFRAESLPPGDYTLVVTLTDPASRRQLSSSLPFVIAAPAAVPGHAG